MKFQKTIVFLLLIGLTASFLSSCGECDGECCKKLEQPVSLQENPAEWQPMYDEVMRVHDEVMPKMGNINRLKQDLERYSRKYRETIDANEIKIIQGHLAALEKGEKGMWDWMHDFKQPEEGAPTDAVNAYLKVELDKITEVSNLMMTSLRDSKNFLDSTDYY